MWMGDLEKGIPSIRGLKEDLEKNVPTFWTDSQQVEGMVGGVVSDTFFNLRANEEALLVARNPQMAVCHLWIVTTPNTHIG